MDDMTANQIDYYRAGRRVRRTVVRRGGRGSERHDFIFFGFWISHIPVPSGPVLGRCMADALAPGGSIFFIENRLPTQGIPRRNPRPNVVEHWQSGDDEIQTRVLNDGARQHTIVKNFFMPHALEAELIALGSRP
jgi:hypothetical protein